MSAKLTRLDSSSQLYLMTPDTTPTILEVDRLKNKNDKFILHFVRVVRGMLKAMPTR